MTTLTPAVDRLLRTAGDLFSREGIRAVGIDRILAEAGAAKATLYQAFGSKEALVVAYLEQRDAGDRRAYRTRVARVERGAERVLASFDLAERAAVAGEYIGCAYANALNEFPDPDRPIAAAVRRHREWLREQWSAGLGGGEAAEQMAARVQLLYDGALLGSKVSRSAEPIRLARALAEEWLAGIPEASGRDASPAVT